MKRCLDFQMLKKFQKQNKPGLDIDQEDYFPPHDAR